MTASSRPWSALVQAAHAAVDPQGFLRSRALRDGDPFGIEVPGLGPVLLTGHPDGVEQLFTAPPATFASVPHNPVEPLLGPGSMILLDGDRHRAERKLVMPALHGDRMRAYGAIIQDAVVDELDRHAPGAVVDVQQLTQAITLQVIVRAIFGVEGTVRQRAVRDAVVALMDAYTAPLMLVPGLRRSVAGLGPWARFQRARIGFDALLRDELDQRRRRRGPPREDILSLLLALRYDDGGAMSDEAVLDELRTLLVAGHETTATALAWALHFVHGDAVLARRLRDEVRGDDTPGALAGAALVGATCSEALRMHPVVPIVLRRVREAFVLRDVPVSPGAIVGVAIPVLHARPEIWPEPARFAPERFVDRRYTPFEYAPFGGGHRRCLGAAFAGYEMRIVLGTLLSRATFEVTSTRPVRPVIRSITTGPSRRLRLRYLGAASGSTPASSASSRT